MNSTLTIIAGICGTLAAVGCGTREPTRSADRSNVVPDGPAIAGVIKDERGENLANLMVQACTARVCLAGRTNAVGRFVIGGLEAPADVIVKTPESDATTPFRAESVTPVHLMADALVDIGTQYVVTLRPPVTLAPASSDPQTVPLGDGLTLTLRRGDLHMPPSVAQDDRISARLIPPQQLPQFAELGAEDVLSVYALFPFGAKSTSAIAVRLPTELPAGTKVHLRTIGELDGRLSAASDATSDGHVLVSQPGTGITELTWLVASR